MGIEQALAVEAAQACTRDERSGVVEGVARNELLLDRAATTFALELTVEGFKALLFCV